MAIYRIKKSFVSGEISPLLEYRTDNPRFINGCRELTNMIVKPQGPVTKRPGTRFIYDLNNLGHDSFNSINYPPLIIPFIYSEEQSYLIVIYLTLSDEPDSGYYLTFSIIYEDGFIKDVDGEVLTYVFQSTTGYIPFTGNLRLIGILDFGSPFGLAFHTGILYSILGGSLFTINILTGKDTLVGNLNILSPFSLASHNGVLYTISYGTASLYTVSILTGQATLVGNLNIDQPFGLVSHNDILYLVNNESLYTLDISTGNATLIGNLNITALPSDLASHNGILYVVSSGSTGLYTIDVDTGNATLVTFFNPEASQPSGIASQNDILYLVSRVEGTLFQINPSILNPSVSESEDPPTIFDFDKLQYIQSNDQLFIVQACCPPIILTRKAHNDWELSLIDFIDPPVVWNPTNGWPETIAFFEQRLVFGGNRSNPQTLWFSKSGNLYDFGRSNPLIESDGLTFTLNSSESNNIQWLVNNQRLLVGTLGDEWTIGGQAGSHLSFNSVSAQKQSSRGSSRILPLSINDVTVFLEKLRRTVNMYAYDYSFESYTTTDLSILAPHLTDRSSIVDWAYQQTPDGLIWCVQENGELLGLTFEREHQVIAWHRHTTKGKFKRVATIPSKFDDRVWFIIERNGRYYLERMEDEFLTGKIEDCRFLDSGLYIGEETKPNMDNKARIGGFEHLGSEDIKVLENGNIIEDGVVLEGTIEFQREVKNLYIGLPFESAIEPMPVDVPGESGTILGRTQKITDTEIMFYRTLGAAIEQSNHPEKEPQEIFNLADFDITLNPPSLFSGIQHINFPEGYARGTYLRISQKQPLPLTVIGVTDVIEVYK